MRSLSSLWLYAALPGVLWAAHVTLMVEGDNNASRICKPAPDWKIKGQAPMQQASNIKGLRDRLNRSNLTEVSFMIVNEQEAHSRAMYWELKRRAPPGVPVYQQAPIQDDVWEALDGDKDDFLVYDRCGLLTFHIVLPYSFLHYPYVEAAIRATYQKNICNCSAHSTLSSGQNSVLKNVTAQPNIQLTTALPTMQLDTGDAEEGDKEPGTQQHIHHHHHHHHEHHHHYHLHYNHQGNQSQHEQDTSQNKSQSLHPLNHHHDPQHNHQHR